jgi:probable rRNA maturation factor
MATDQTTSVTRMTKGKLPRLPFSRIKEVILGKHYELSIVFATPAVSQKLNREFRGKDHPTNILSFPLSKTSGELVISLSTVRRDAPKFEKTYPKFLCFLLIHGMLHLKGFEHGSTMERQEERFSKTFNC